MHQFWDFWGQAVNIKTICQFVSSHTYLMKLQYVRIALGFQAPIFLNSPKSLCRAIFLDLQSNPLLSSSNSPCSTHLLMYCDLGNTWLLIRPTSRLLESESRREVEWRRVSKIIQEHIDQFLLAPHLRSFSCWKSYFSVTVHWIISPQCKPS